MVSSSVTIANVSTASTTSLHGQTTVSELRTQIIMELLFW